MKIVLVVFLLIGGAWVRGEDMPYAGWSPVEYATMSKCLNAVERAIALQAGIEALHPNTARKLFDCEVRDE